MFGSILRILDCSVLPFRLHLFEWCDLNLTPDFIKHCCQSTLTKQWTTRLPIIQSQAPATLAASLLHQLLGNITDASYTDYTVIDFCSGAGGPIPFIEKQVNSLRMARHERPIPFRMSDLVPNLDAWMEASSHSANLSFIPQPVDVVHPPPSTISSSVKTTSALFNVHQASNPNANVNGKMVVREDGKTAGTKTIHLFALSFHHFPDAIAKRILANTLHNSDAFAIIELQERTLGSVLLLSMQWLLLMLMTLFWFGLDVTHIAYTYWVPILPFMMTWDGLVSCLRTRTTNEVFALLREVMSEQSVARGQAGLLAEDDDLLHDWTLSAVRQRHTWPSGYMTAVVGIRNEIRKQA